MVVVLASIVLASCTGDEPEAGGRSVDRPAQGGEIIVAVDSEATSLLPHEAPYSLAFAHLATAVLEPLVARDAGGEIRPYLAESVVPDEEFRTWVVTLRPGVRFHDGSALSADEVVAVYRDHILAEGSLLAGQLPEVAEVRSEGPLRVVFSLVEPDATFIDQLAGPAGLVFSPAHGGDRPVGTGPFAVERWERDSMLVVERNPDYWREGLPYLDRITFRPIPDEALRAESLLTGNVHAIATLRGATIKTLEARGGSEVVMDASVSDDVGVFAINVLEPPFDDVRVRRATAMMADPRALAEVSGDDGLVGPATQYFSSASPWYSERVAASAPGFDPEGARRLLEAYRNDPDRSDGRDPGDPVGMRYQCVEDPSVSMLTMYLAAQARDIGFEVEVDSVDTAAYITDVTGTPDTDPPFRGDYQVTCALAQGAATPAALFALHFGPVGSTPSNYTNFSHPEIDARIERLVGTDDFAAQYQLVEEIGLLVNEQAPVAYSLEAPAAVATRAEVRGARAWTLPDSSPGADLPGGVARWGEAWLQP